jgi:hypothetical protein
MDPFDPSSYEIIVGGNLQEKEDLGCLFICFLCQTGSSEGEADPLTGRAICLPCYERAISQDEQIIEALAPARMCSKCNATSTSQWLKTADKTGDVCKKCYQANQRALAKSGALEKTCSICEVTETSQWCKIADKAGDACKKCYEANRRALAKSGVLEKTCSVCQATSASEWRKTADKTGDVCMKCYQANRRALAKSGVLGKTCSKCQATSTSKWLKTADKTGNVCNKCHQANQRALAKSRTLGETCTNETGKRKKSMKTQTSPNKKNKTNLSDFEAAI